MCSLQIAWLRSSSAGSTSSIVRRPLAALGQMGRSDDSGTLYVSHSTRADCSSGTGHSARVAADAAHAADRADAADATTAADANREAADGRGPRRPLDTRISGIRTPRGAGSEKRFSFFSEGRFRTLFFRAWNGLGAHEPGRGGRSRDSGQPDARRGVGRLPPAQLAGRTGGPPRARPGCTERGGSHLRCCCTNGDCRHLCRVHRFKRHLMARARHTSSTTHLEHATPRARHTTSTTHPEHDTPPEASTTHLLKRARHTY